MELSKTEEKMIGLQYQMRENQKELQDFLSDLGSWEDEMKHKEAELKKKPDNKPQELPPVRNSLDKKKLKKKKKKKPEDQGKPKRISGFDFRAWDKFDVDKALEEVDKEEGEKSSSEYETDEEWEAERKKHLANEKKNEVRLTLNRYAAAEADCVTAITLDPLYVKAYLRRAAARVGLQRLPQALEDYRRVLQLEPTNKQAKTELERLEKELNRDQDGMPTASSLEKSQTSEVKPIYKPPEQRSKKPLRRIEIEEIGVKENTQRKEAIAKVEAAQSAVKKELEAKDRQMFERFTADSVSVRQSSAANGGDRNDGQMTPGDIPALRNSQMQEVPASQQNGIAQHTNASGDSSSVNSKISSTDSGKQNSQKQTKPSVAKPLSPRSAGGGLNSVDSILNREPPQTSYQFQADFKVLKSEDEAFYAYLKRIDPSQYSKLFGQSLEAVVLLKIVDAIQRHFIPAKEDFFQHLKNLSEVKRFSMTVMFLSAKEKQGIRDIFQHLRTQSGHPQEQVEALAKKYEV
ncbi:hypothetical protein BaRGS_00015096 [Batillaria attramentaria]|uniref:RNA polymerase II-associated protein 3 n=1 Tax=Batillaria attramentaria TaxID=370345 RepID=A0ABD0L374_9CAEN